MITLDQQGLFGKKIEEIKPLFINVEDEAVLEWIQNDLSGLRLDPSIIDNIKNALEELTYDKLSPIVGNISNINKENISKLKTLSLIYAWSRTGIIYTGSFYSVPSTYTNEFFIDQIYQFFKLDNSKQEWDKFFIVISYILQLENHFNSQQSQKPKLEEEA